MKVLKIITATTAVMGSLVLNSPAYAASKKIWFCQAVCIAVDSEAKSVQLAGRKALEGSGKYRMDAYRDMTDACSEAARRLGMPEAIPASRFSYQMESDRSGSESWSVSSRDLDFESSARSSENEHERESRRRFWRYDTRSLDRSANSESFSRLNEQERFNSGSQSFSTHDDFTLSVDPAAMTDPAVCSQEAVDANWIPYYQPMPGIEGPMG